MPDAFFNGFKQRWLANEERYRRNRQADAIADGQEPDVAAELEHCKLQRYSLLRELVIRLSKESVCGAGLRDAQLAELIDAAKLVAGSEGCQTPQEGQALDPYGRIGQ